jgi:hypothetical protein
MADNKNIKGFKKFSEMKKSDEIEEVEPGVLPETDSDRPAVPNLPNDGKKIEKPASREGVIPKDQDIKLGKTATEQDDEEEEEVDENQRVKFYGKVAKFPNETKASKAFNFLENVKIPKNSIWYILVEKQSNELQMLKYNNKQGVDMERFVLELKGFYLKKYVRDPKMTALIENITVRGASEFSAIQNIPNVEVEKGKKMITKITEDLLKLLSK